MKSIIKFSLIVFLFLTSVNLFADNSKKTKIDLDVKTTHIIKADLDQDDFYYYIDTNACICWLAMLVGSSSSVTAIDCTKLSAHPGLEKYVSRCVSTSKMP